MQLAASYRTKQWRKIVEKQEEEREERRHIGYSREGLKNWTWKEEQLMLRDKKKRRGIRREKIKKEETI